MTIAASVTDHLSREGVPYEVITHEHTRDSNHSAEAAHIPGDQLAKCVMLEDGEGYLMAVLPATHKVDLGAIHRQLNRKLSLATDHELADFITCIGPPKSPGQRLFEHAKRAVNNENSDRRGNALPEERKRNSLF